MKFSTEFKVGLTVLTATAILVFGIIWGKNFRFEDRRMEIEVLFENVGGMQPGEPVTINGVKTGKVKSVTPYNRKVLTLLEVPESLNLYSDASFIVISDELLAGMRVEIYPGDSDKPLNMSAQPFEGKYGGRIVDVGIIIGDLAEEMTALTHRIDTTVIMVNNMLERGNIEEEVTLTLKNLRQASANLNSFINTNSGTFQRTVNNLERGSATFSAILDSNEASINETLRTAQSVSMRLDSISLSLNRMLAQIETQQGTLGKMVYDPQLYINLNKTLASLDSLAQQIKKEGLDIDLF